MKEDCFHQEQARTQGEQRIPPWFRLPATADLLRIAGAALTIALIYLGVFGTVGGFDVFGTFAVALCGYPILKGAFQALCRRRMTMELSMTIALIAALAVSEVVTALVIIFFVLIAEEIEKLTIASGRRSIEHLLDLLPGAALRRQGEEIQEIDIKELLPGDIVVVRPGGRLVVDGLVVSGSSFVDESTITGESFPAEKVPGSRVYAGSINQLGAIEIKAEKVGADTAFGKIVHAVEEAERSRAAIQKTADRLAGYLVYFAAAAAGATFAVTHDVRQTISVIIVAGACGIAAGTPLAILGAIGRAARRGSVVKGGLYLERLSSVDTVVFDKTGTLTYGTPRVVEVMALGIESKESVLSVAASAEGFSEHPLARAIGDYAEELAIKPAKAHKFSYIPGRGITCVAQDAEIAVGNRALMNDLKVGGVNSLAVSEHASEVMVARGRKLIGRILIADAIRPESKGAVRALHELGVRTMLLSGDSAPVVAAVAKQLAIGEFAAELSPEQKRARIVRLQAQGRTTAMVGDGVNDAPALMEAAVGVAVGSGTDVALESADIVLIGNDMLKFVEAVRIARQCRRVIYANFAGTLAVDGLGMALAFAGVLNPLLAALIHVGSEAVFLLNSARLFPVFGSREPSSPPEP